MHTVFLYDDRCRKEKECEFDGGVDIQSMIQKIFKRHERRSVKYYIVFNKKEKKLLKKIITILYGVKYNNEILFFEFFQNYIGRLNINALLCPCYISTRVKGEKYPYSPENRALIEKEKYSLAMKVSR